MPGLTGTWYNTSIFFHLLSILPFSNWITLLYQHREITFCLYICAKEARKTQNNLLFISLAIVSHIKSTESLRCIFAAIWREPVAKPTRSFSFPSHLLSCRAHSETCWSAEVFFQFTLNIEVNPVSHPPGPPVNYLVKYTYLDKEHSQSTWYVLSKCHGGRNQSECKAVYIVERLCQHAHAQACLPRSNHRSDSPALTIRPVPALRAPCSSHQGQRSVRFHWGEARRHTSDVKEVKDRVGNHFNCRLSIT